MLSECNFGKITVPKFGKGCKVNLGSKDAELHFEEEGKVLEMIIFHLKNISLIQ